MALGVLLDEHDTPVRVVQGLDLVTNAHDHLLLALALLNESLGRQPLIQGCREHLRGVVQGPAESGADRREARDQRRDEVLASPRSHDRVVGARHARTMVCTDDHAELDELRDVPGQPPPEPEQCDGAADAEFVVRRDLGDGDSGIGGLGPAVIGDGTHEVRTLAHEALFSELVKIGWQRRREWLASKRDDDSTINQGLVDLGDEVPILVETPRHMRTRLPERQVFRSCGLIAAAGAGTGVPELHIVVESLGGSAATPSDHRLGDASVRDRIGDEKLLATSDLAKQHHHLDRRVLLEAQQHVDEADARPSVAADGDAFPNAVGVEGHDVVELVRHAARLRGVADRARAIKLREQQILHGPSGIPDAEAPRHNATNCGGPDDAHPPFRGFLVQAPRQGLRNTLCNDGVGADDVAKLKGLQRCVVDRAEGCKVDQDVRSLAVSLHCICQPRVDGNQHIGGAEHELLKGCLACGIDDRGHAGCLPAAKRVEIQHPLHGLRLESIHNRLSARVERHDAASAAAASSGPLDGSGLRKFDHQRRELRQGLGHAGLRDERIAHDRREMRLGAEDLGGHADVLASALHQCEAFGVVRPSPAHPHTRAAGLQRGPELLQSPHQALERAGDIREVGNTTTNQQDLAVRFGRARHDSQDDLRVLIDEVFRRVARILSIIGKLLGEAILADRVGVDDAGATSGNECPDASLAIQKGELQGSPGAAVQLVNGSLFGQLQTSKWGWKPAGAPLGTTEVARGLVELQLRLDDEAALTHGADPAHQLRDV
mmetsp:Transcript_110320/g.351639  ORF Transcript_110320/g.351639 Transcript_110320/m.351639 type:complete len:774 (-) Transcript_110320:597-2918(-)